MTYLPPATAEEMAEPGWAERRNARWYELRQEWVRQMEAAGYRVKLRKLKRTGRPEPGTVDAGDSESG